MKRIGLNAKGGIVLTQMAVLTDSQAEKLESSYLRKEIEALAKRLKFRWYIENNGQQLMLCCSRVFEHREVEDSDMHDLEMQQDLFLSEIDKIELEKPTPEEKEDEKLNEDIVELMHKIMSDEKIAHAELIVLEASLPIGGVIGSCIGRVVGSCGRISKSLLNEMCQAWLDTHKQA